MRKSSILMMVTALTLIASSPQVALSFDDTATLHGYGVLEDAQGRTVGMCFAESDGNEIWIEVTANSVRRGHAYTVWKNIKGAGNTRLDGDLAGSRSLQLMGHSDIMSPYADGDSATMTVLDHGRAIKGQEIVQTTTNIGTSSSGDPNCRVNGGRSNCRTVGACTVTLMAAP